MINEKEKKGPDMRSLSLMLLNLERLNKGIIKEGRKMAEKQKGAAGASS